MSASAPKDHPTPEPRTSSLDPDDVEAQSLRLWAAHGRYLDQEQAREQAPARPPGLPEASDAPCRCSHAYVEHFLQGQPSGCTDWGCRCERYEPTPTTLGPDGMDTSGDRFLLLACLLGSLALVVILLVLVFGL